MARYGRQGPVGIGGWLAVFVGALGLGLLLSAAMVAEPAGISLAQTVSSAAASPLSAAAFRPLGYAAIWTAHLLRSDRVANTYAPSDDALADVFG